MGEPALLTAVEIGGSGAQTTVFTSWSRYRRFDGVHEIADVPVALAAPGIFDGQLIRTAANLGWESVSPQRAVGLSRAPVLFRNDAAAAAYGEAALRGSSSRLAYVGLGTGVGGAVVTGAEVTGNLFGHSPGFGSRVCTCGATGCLETVAGGWALPEPLGRLHLEHVSEAVARVLRQESPPDALVVVGGGLARRYPEILVLLEEELGRPVEGSAAPGGAKSAAAWGLLAEHVPSAVPHSPG